MVNKAGRKGFTSSGNSGGSKVSHHNANRGFSPFPVRGINTVSVTNSTLLAGLNAGITTISGSTALTAIMPLASDAIGGTYILRNTSAHSHILTGSLEAAGTEVFSTVSGTLYNSGSAFTLGNVVGDSVVLLCDGVNFVVIGGSGSIGGTP